jgi:magnesium-transporting ATPase (P-type)
MSFSKDLLLGMKKSRRRQMPTCNILLAKVFEPCVWHTEYLTVSRVHGSSSCLATDLHSPVIDSVYEQWQKQFHEASVALENREDRIETVSASIERDLVLLGATAIEDKLQDGVPETIADLKRAGIKVWVATGDKLETAVAIGYTTNLLTKDSNMIIVREGRHEIYDQLKNAIEGFFGEDVREMDNQGNLQPVDDVGGHELRRLDTGVTSLVGRDNGTRSGGYSLVIDGGALRHVSARSCLYTLQQSLICISLR